MNNGSVIRADHQMFIRRVQSYETKKNCKVFTYKYNTIQFSVMYGFVFISMCLQGIVIGHIYMSSEQTLEMTTSNNI